MKNLFYILVLPCLFSCSIKAQENSRIATEKNDSIPFILHDIDLKWSTDSIGVKMAVLQGDPFGNGLYAVRMIFPANWRIAPHWHDEMESITVLKGTLFVGRGKDFIMGKAVPIKEGGSGSMPPKVVHYAFTTGECIAQVYGMGPVKRYFK